MGRTQSGGGFTDEGRRYEVRSVDFVERADAELCNEHYTLQIDQRGRVYRSVLLDPEKVPLGGKLRAFYVRDDASGALFSAPFDPVCARPDRFRFSIGRADLRWSVARGGVHIDIEAVVDRAEPVELWTVALSNASKREREISLLSLFPIVHEGTLAHRAWYERSLRGMLYESVPYYVRYQQCAQIRERAWMVCCLCDTVPDEWEFDAREFCGCGGLHLPAALAKVSLRSPRGPFDAAMGDAAAILRHRRTLAPGASVRMRYLFGAVRTPADAAALRRRYFTKTGFAQARDAAARVFDERSPALRIETPDTDFDHFVNYWLPRRVLVMNATIRGAFTQQARNTIQDAMGGVLVDAALSRARLLVIWAHQHADGWMPHGICFAPGVTIAPISNIPHKDSNVWGPDAISFYCAHSGDWAILDEEVPFGDKPAKRASLYEHICRGLDWLLRDRTRRGLCRIGQGDWNDPLNMAGCGEKGESVWLTEALAYALDTWAAVARRRSDTKRARRYTEEARRCRDVVNDLAWDGGWYARGFTDAGRMFGCRADKEGRIYLNAQSWAIIGGVADKERARAALRAVEEQLMTASGPMMLTPPFTRFYDDIGKISQKIPGFTENGSVYCHAATFYAYARYLHRDADAAFHVLRTLLSGGEKNTIERTGQLPVGIPNFYHGTGAGISAGRSSHSLNTGTAPWYYRTVLTMLFGIRPGTDGLRIDPQLPSRWKKAKAQYRWRGATFDIDITRETGAAPARVTLDGRPCEGCVIPLPREGARHRVQVRIA